SSDVCSSDLQVGGEGVLVGGVESGAVGVDVDGHQVGVRSPPPRVDRHPGAEREVGGDGHVGGGGAQHGAQGPVVAAHRLGEEAAEVQQVAGVGQVLGGAGRLDVLRGRVRLAPEGGGPGVVERVQAGGASAQPGGEGAGGGLAVGVGAVLVVDPPQPQGGVAGVAFGEGAGDPQGRLPVGGGAHVV